MTHIDDTAIAVVGAVYEELGITGNVLDLMGSWVSHFKTAPERLAVLGMNFEELMANPQATNRWVKDLNEDPELAFEDDFFDHAVCSVSVDYLVHPFSCSARSRESSSRAVTSSARSRMSSAAWDTSSVRNRTSALAPPTARDRVLPSGS